MANPVQTKAAIQGSGASLAVTFDSNVTAGNLIAVSVAIQSTGVTINSVTDSLSNTYTIVNNPTDVASALRCAMAYAKNITGGACTVTATFSASPGVSEIVVHEVEGRNTTSPLDDSAMLGESFVGTSRTSGSITTTVANDYIFGCSTNINNRTYTAGSGFTLRNTTLGDSVTEDQIQSAAGSIAATFTMNADGNSVTGIMAFKAGGVTLTAVSGSYTLTGTAMVLRPGSTTWLRYRK